MTVIACPSDRELERLLQEEPADAGAIAGHLEACPRCRARLEQLAAGEATWDAVAARLNRPQLAGPELAAAMAALKTAAHTGAESEEVSPDLPPGFLAPPRQPGHLGRLDHFDVVEEIGRGEMGIVLKAIDEKLQRIVALKVMSPRLAGNAASRKRFIREGRAAAAVCHEHVVTIHGVEEGALLPYFVMQYISGHSLQQRLERSGPLEVTEILRIGMQTAEGLAAAHAQGLVHRDIKPANILLENGVERVKITDFGLARAVDDASLTRSGVIAGTPLFMAPEQARGEAVDHRADLFSLGCVLYTLATGRPPFRAATTMAVLRRICDDEPRPIRELNPAIPDWLAATIGRLLVKDPSQRYSSAKELAELLAGCLAHAQQPGSVPLPSAVASTPPHVSKMTAIQAPMQAPRRNWFSTPAGITVLVAVLIAPFVLLVGCAGLAVFGYWIMPIGGRPANRPIVPDPIVHDHSHATVSAAELAELKRLVDIAEAEMRQSRALYEAGRVAAGEHVQTEIDLASAQARYLKAAGQLSQQCDALRRKMELHEQLLRFTNERVKALAAPDSERLAAERALTEAKLELQAAEREMGGRH